MKKILPYIFIILTTTIIAQAPQCHWVTIANSIKELAPAMYVLQVDECRYKIVKQ